MPTAAKDILIDAVHSSPHPTRLRSIISRDALLGYGGSHSRSMTIHTNGIYFHLGHDDVFL